MSTNSVLYPVSPENVSESVIQPSSEFKKEVFNVLTAIILFVVVYIFLVTVAVALAGICALGGIFIISTYPSILTLLLGIGLVGSGLLVLFFLIKFIFQRSKRDTSGLLQIHEQDQPELFAFIRQLTRETQTPFPKKIFISPDVNAAVFYNSSFLSMFFPIRKNLVIGLGLVNAINLSEFKAILAHEFGHFSQRSMKLGSYVYNVNKVIYNMLYDNHGYGKTLDGFASISGYFALFASVTVKIVQGIQGALENVYGLINRRYSNLSQQMEFHADAVAAYVSGSDHLISSLRRLESTEVVYNRVFGHYNSWYNESVRPANIYPQQTVLTKLFADDFDIPMENGLMKIDARTFANFERGRIIIKDQWASHPSTDDRETRLRRLSCYTPTNHAPAWSVFRNVEQLQKEVTDMIYRDVKFKDSPRNINVDEFKNRVYAEHKKHAIDTRYKGFFDGRNIEQVDLRTVNPSVAAASLDELLTAEVLALPQQINGLKSDISILEHIISGAWQIKSFDFDGVRYEAGDARKIESKLKEELKQHTNELRNADLRMIEFFVSKAKQRQQDDELLKKYSAFLELVQTSTSLADAHEGVITKLRPFYYGGPEQNVFTLIRELTAAEDVFYEKIQFILGQKDILEGVAAEDLRKLETFAKTRLIYFTDHYNNEAFTQLDDVLTIFESVTNDWALQAKKNHFDFLLQYLN